MKRRRPQWVLLWAVVLLAGGLPALSARADTEETTFHPFSGFADHAVDSITGDFIPYGIAAVFSTIFLVFSEADRDLQDWFQEENPIGQDVAWASLFAGNLTPVLPGGVLYLAGLATDDDHLTAGGSAALQAVLINLIVTTVLKVVTDRPAPLSDEHDNDTSFPRRSVDAADWDLNPFRFDGGVFWPSGHTSSHVAMASALVAFFPDEGWLPWVVYPVAAFVGLTMIEGDFHWTSDVVAGALIGHAIGWIVGTQFREEYEARRTPETEEELLWRLNLARLPEESTSPWLLPTPPPVMTLSFTY